MNKKNNYIKPQVYIIELECEGIIATRNSYLIGIHQEGEDLAAGSRKRNLWNEIED